MRILHFQLDGQLGGIEMFLFNLMSTIGCGQMQFEYVTSVDHPALGDKFIEMGGKIHHVPPYKNYLKYIREVRNLMKDDYDIVHVHKNSAANIIPITEAKKAGKKVVVHSHNTFPSKGKIPYVLHKINYRRMNRLADYRLACSTEAGTWMFGNNDFKVVPNGIQTSKYIYEENKRKKIREEFQIPEDCFVVGNIGRFTEQKNHKRLITIFSEFHKLNPYSMLLLIGDGALRDEIEDMVKRMGLSEIVILAGLRDDIPDVLMAMDSFVMPSLYEGLPIVAIEAQATGISMYLSDTISKETDVSGDITWFSLNAADIEIASKIKVELNTTNRKSASQKMKEKGFDIGKTAYEIQTIYRTIQDNED